MGRQAKLDAYSDFNNKISNCEKQIAGRKQHDGVNCCETQALYRVVFEGLSAKDALSQIERCIGKTNGQRDPKGGYGHAHATAWAGANKAECESFKKLLLGQK